MLQYFLYINQHNVHVSVKQLLKHILFMYLFIFIYLFYFIFLPWTVFMVNTHTLYEMFQKSLFEDFESTEFQWNEILLLVSEVSIWYFSRT